MAYISHKKTIPKKEDKQTVPKMITAQLSRKSDDGVETLGELSFTTATGEHFACKTLELPYKGNAHMISCIPAGRYIVKWGYMANHNVNHYLLQDVPNRSGIFIHGAAYHTDLLGCLGCGYSYADFNKDGEPDIVNSRQCISDMEKLLNKEDFILIITPPPTAT